MPSVQRMVEADVFSILVGCVEVDAEGNEVTDLVVGGLRCTRRIIRSQELAFEYCNAGKAIVRWIVMVFSPCHVFWGIRALIWCSV